MKKLIGITMALLMVLLLVAGCSSPGTTGEVVEKSQDQQATAPTESTAPTDQASAETKAYKFGYSHASKQDIFHVALEYYMKEAAKDIEAETGTKIELTFTVADNDVNKQQSDVMDLINAGNQVVMMSAIDTNAIGAAIKACHDANIPAVTVVRPESEDGEKADAFVAVETVKQGYSTGAAVFEKMKADGVLDQAKALNIIGDLRDQNAVNRSDGFKQACEEYNVPIIAEIECEWNNDLTLQRATAILQEKPEINVIFCPTDGVIQGLQTAMEANDRWFPYGEEGHVYLGSQDAYPIGYELTAAGYIDANTVFDPVFIGRKALELSIALADGKDLGAEGRVLLEGRVMTQENCETMEDLWARDYEQ